MSHRRYGRGIPVARRSWRVTTDRVAVVLPFEEAFLRDAGANAVYVGHPLARPAGEHRGREDWAAAHRLDPDRHFLALLPGSREQEIDRHLELFVATADRVVRQLPDVQPVIVQASDLPSHLYGSPAIPLIKDSGEVLRHASAALVKSGTSTLQAGLAGVPFVVAYRMSPLTHTIARRLVNVPHIALANLVLEKRAIPEFVQNDATPEALAGALLPLLADSPERRRMMAELETLQGRLGEQNASEEVAEIALELLQATRAGENG